MQKQEHPCLPMEGGRMERKREKKDTVEKEFVSYPDIAADVVNALLYQGEKEIGRAHV